MNEDAIKCMIKERGFQAESTNTKNGFNKMIGSDYDDEFEFPVGISVLELDDIYRKVIKSHFHGHKMYNMDEEALSPNDSMMSEEEFNEKLKQIKRY